tara:strand:- start:7 stop:450 length:444 start_codon:yes stop_codon:yes gene_type:complete
MINLMKSLALTVAVLLTTSSAANAWYSTGANPTSIGTINVVLEDGAKDACWTNLREVREYAEEKLKIKGYNAVAEKGDGYTFEISVDAFRSDAGTCIGHYATTIWASNYRNGIFGVHEIGNRGSFGTNPNNFNTWVINLISKMIAEM